MYAEGGWKLKPIVAADQAFERLIGNSSHTLIEEEAVVNSSSYYNCGLPAAADRNVSGMLVYWAIRSGVNVEGQHNFVSTADLEEAELVSNCLRAVDSGLMSVGKVLVLPVQALHDCVNV